MTGNPLKRRKRILADVVEEHANEAADLWALRSAVAVAPHTRLFDLARFDARIAAHLDGLAVAGDESWPFCDAMLEEPSAGAAFVVAARTIEEKQQKRLDRVFAVAEAVPGTRAGLASAFGWLEPGQLQGTVAGLLKSEHAFRRMVGVAACGMHLVDPGLASGPFLRDAAPSVRGRALRAAGELGRRECLAAAAAAIVDDDADCRFWAARSAVLLGDRDKAQQSLSRIAIGDGCHRSGAFRLALQAMTVSAGHALLQRLAADPAQLRWLIEGSGIVGDPAYVPWLVRHMEKNDTARVAGEAFTLITGADLDALHLDRPRPEAFESGPTDDPDDPNVGVDRDEGLPWPDPKRVHRWWDANGARFEPGTRYFMGAPVTRARSIQVMRDGCQRQRTLAASHLCLLAPGTSLFNTRAPAWRQQALLARME